MKGRPPPSALSSQPRARRCHQVRRSSKCASQFADRRCVDRAGLRGSRWPVRTTTEIFLPIDRVEYMTFRSSTHRRGALSAIPILVTRHSCHMIPQLRDRSQAQIPPDLQLNRRACKNLRQSRHLSPTAEIGELGAIHPAAAPALEKELSSYEPPAASDGGTLVARGTDGLLYHRAIKWHLPGTVAVTTSSLPPAHRSVGPEGSRPVIDDGPAGGLFIGWPWVSAVGRVRVADAPCPGFPVSSRVPE